MRHRIISCFCWIAAIVVMAGLWLLAHFTIIGEVLILVSIIWSCVDDLKSQIWKYRSGLSGGLMMPLSLFLLLVFLWPLTFPWYLGLRLKILLGVAELREEFQPWKMSDDQMSPNGLIQPWRGRKL